MGNEEVVEAIEYKGPRTGITTDTYIVRLKRDAQGKLLLLPKGTLSYSSRCVFEGGGNKSRKRKIGGVLRKKF